MQIAIGKMKRSSYNEPYYFEDNVDVSELETLNNDIREINLVYVKGYCYIQGDKIISSFSIKGEMILPCARTLVDVPYPFNIHAEEVFTLSAYSGKEEEENEIHPISGETLDLTPHIKENILLEVPFRVFSNDKEAEEQATFKGNGWEFVSAEEKQHTVDPRLKKLENLFNDKEK
ncbi:YceD family protein [Virgibacillus flavescens]|uniref:YceD family protein n=1 Tax=Virgibacillus flavescens TaxID=1611422 RepID=UPI003D340CF9